jgi:hypothetical protein
MGFDKMTSRHVCDNPFMIRFSDRCEWKVFQPDRNGGLIWYTYVSKAKKALELGCIATNTRTQQYSRQKYTPLRYVQPRI